MVLVSKWQMCDQRRIDDWLIRAVKEQLFLRNYQESWTFSPLDGNGTIDPTR